MYVGRTPASVASRFSALSSSARLLSKRAASCPSVPDSSDSLPESELSASAKPATVS